MHENGKIQKKTVNITNKMTHHIKQFYKTKGTLTTQQTSLHLCRPHDLFLLHRLSHMNVIAAIKRKKKVLTFRSLRMLRIKPAITMLC